jgi:hypothetical protein
MAAQPKDNLKTLEINKFGGNLTRFRDGDINSGMANYYTSWGYDTFQRSGTLSFDQAPYSVGSGVITDCVMDMKVRIENNNICYVYALGSTGRIYKIQVNNPGVTPDYDNAVLFYTLVNNQTFHYGASLNIFNLTGNEGIYIGCDQGVTSLAWAGGFGSIASETVITTTAGTWTPTVPRQGIQFNGNVYYTNGSNLCIMTGAGTVNGQALATGFPNNVQARSISSTADGRYIVTACGRTPLGDMLSVSPDIGNICATNSSLYYWNGTDNNYTSSTTFPSFTISTYYTFSSNEYVFGNQIGGPMLASPTSNSGGGTVLEVLEYENIPLPNAIGSSGDFMGWGSTGFSLTTGQLYAVLDLYGTLDQHTPVGMYRQLVMYSSLTGGDVIRIPAYSAVSSWNFTGITQGYTSIVPFQNDGTGKTYFSTIEYNGSTTKYGFYAFKNVLDFQQAAGPGVYETQHQPFSKKVKITEVRVYLEYPGAEVSLVAFTIDLIAIDGSVIPGGSNTFSSSNQLTSTGDVVKYNPNHAPQSTIGVRITNVGAVSPFIHRIELDWEPMGS